MAAGSGARGAMEPVSQPNPTSVRPPQVTVAAWMIMVGSVFVVLMVWDRIAGLHSLETRTTLQSVLDDPGVKGLGLQVTDLMLIVRVVSMVAAGCAAAMVVLGYQTLQRSRSARTVLSILAFPLFFSGLVTGGYVSSGVAAAVATLWLGPARMWFDGRSAPAARDTTGPLSGGLGQSPPPGQAVPPATPDTPSGDAPSSETWAAPPTSVYDARRSSGFGAARPPGQAVRPATVMWACVVTWLLSGLTALVLGVSVAVLAAESSTVLRRMHEQNPRLAEQGLSDHTILVVCYVFCVFCVLWSLAAAAFAVLVYRGVRWAWYALVASTSAVAVLSLVGMVGSLLTVVPFTAAAATVALLLRPESRRWFG
jgi:hypothetical protein